MQECEDHLFVCFVPFCGYKNLIAEVKNQFDNAVISQYNYTNDKLGRRTQRIDVRKVKC